MYCSHVFQRLMEIVKLGIDLSIGTMHECRSANVVGIGNVNTVLLNGKIMIFKSF